MKIKKYDYLTDFPADIDMDDFDDFDEQDFHLFKVSENGLSKIQNNNYPL